MTDADICIARMTLIMSSRTLYALVSALEREPTPERIATVAPMLREMAQGLQHAHECIAVP